MGGIKKTQSGVGHFRNLTLMSTQLTTVRLRAEKFYDMNKSKPFVPSIGQGDKSGIPIHEFIVYLKS